MTKPLSFSSNQNLPRLGISPTGYIVPDTLDDYEDWYGRLSLILKTNDEFLVFYLAGKKGGLITLPLRKKLSSGRGM